MKILHSRQSRLKSIFINSTFHIWRFQYTMYAWLIYVDVHILEAKFQ